MTKSNIILQTIFNIIENESGVGPSDHTSFYINDIPVLHFDNGEMSKEELMKKLLILESKNLEYSALRKPEMTEDEQQQLDRAILEMSHQIKISQSFKNQNKTLFDEQCLTIPFEKFVIKPWPYLEQVEILLKTKINNKTGKILKRQNIPRENIVINENEIISFLKHKNASNSSIELLDEISNNY